MAKKKTFRVDNVQVMFPSCQNALRTLGLPMSKVFRRELKKRGHMIYRYNGIQVPVHDRSPTRPGRVYGQGLMRIYLTKVLRAGLKQTGFYKGTYKQAWTVMKELERRLDELEWACQQLKASHSDLYVRGRAMVILRELKELKQEPPQL